MTILIVLFVCFFVVCLSLCVFLKLIQKKRPQKMELWEILQKECENKRESKEGELSKAH